MPKLQWYKAKKKSWKCLCKFSNSNNNIRFKKSNVHNNLNLNYQKIHGFILDNSVI